MPKKKGPPEKRPVEKNVGNVKNKIAALGSVKSFAQIGLQPLV